MSIDLTTDADTKKLDREECEALVKSWFEDFEAQDEIRKQMLIKKQVNPFFDWNNKYLGAFIMHCPVFKELFNTQSAYSISMLWEIKNYKLKLCKATMEKVSTSKSCGVCFGKNKGCKVWQNL
jgi:hypothetical protein